MSYCRTTLFLLSLFIIQLPSHILQKCTVSIWYWPLAPEDEHMDLQLLRCISFTQTHLLAQKKCLFFSLAIFSNQLLKSNLVAFLCIETTTACVRALQTWGTRHGRVQTAKQTSAYLLCCYNNHPSDSIFLEKAQHPPGCSRGRLKFINDGQHWNTPMNIKLPLMWTEQRTSRFIWEYFMTSFENVIFPLLLRFQQHSPGGKIISKQSIYQKVHKNRETGMHRQSSKRYPKPYVFSYLRIKVRGTK